MIDHTLKGLPSILIRRSFPERNTIVHAAALSNFTAELYLDVPSAGTIPTGDFMKTVEDHLDKALDAALEMTFPASDPIAVYIAEPRSKIQNEMESRDQFRRRYVQAHSSADRWLETFR
jgi:hypothetical protein